MREQYETVLWLDPGKTTGWATFTAGHSFDSGESDFLQVGRDLESYAKYHHSRLAVGYEKFIVTPGAGRKNPEYSFEVIGMVKWICYVHGATLLTPAASADRTPGMEGDKLRKLGWHKPTEGGHADDAAAHLLAWLLRENRVPKAFMNEILKD